MTKRLLTIMMALAMVFAFNAVATASNYGVWEDSAPGKVAGTYEWTYGDLIGTPHDYVKIEREWDWMEEYKEVWYTFSMDNVEKPPPYYKEVHFEASWLATQDIFDDDFSGWYDISYITPEGYSVYVTHEEWLDTDGDGEIDGVTADWIIPEGCPLYEGVKIYDYTLGDGTEGNRWYIEYARMETNCVPIPGTLLLLGSGLIGLIGLGRRKLKVRG